VSFLTRRFISVEEGLCCVSIIVAVLV
jgi:hypothetical protein